MAYTKEDILRNRAKRSNGHEIFYDDKLHVIDAQAVKEVHLSSFARVLDNTKDVGLKIEAVKYINGLLKGDRHSRKEKEFMRKSNSTATISSDEKGFWGRIKRSTRKIKDIFKPSERKILEDAVSCLAHDIARRPSEYMGNNIFEIIDSNNVSYNHDTRHGIEICSEHRDKRELAQKLQKLSNSKPQARAVQQTTVTREQILSRNGGKTL